MSPARQKTHQDLIPLAQPFPLRIGTPQPGGQAVSSLPTPVSADGHDPAAATVRNGLVLAEILIAVGTLGILAAIIVLQFSQTGGDPRYVSTVLNLQTLRMQIDLSRAQHQGGYPGNASGGHPDAGFARQMSERSNAVGGCQPPENRDPLDLDFPLWPYVRNRLPANPFNGSRTVVTVTEFPTDAPGGNSPSDPGWVYE